MLLSQALPASFPTQGVIPPDGRVLRKITAQVGVVACKISCCKKKTVGQYCEIGHTVVTFVWVVVNSLTINGPVPLKACQTSAVRRITRTCNCTPFPPGPRTPQISQPVDWTWPLRPVSVLVHGWDRIKNVHSYSSLGLPRGPKVVPFWGHI